MQAAPGNRSPLAPKVTGGLRRQGLNKWAWKFSTTLRNRTEQLAGVFVGMPAPLLLYLWVNSVSVGLRKDAWLNCKEQVGTLNHEQTDFCVVQVYSIYTHKARQ